MKSQHRALLSAFAAAFVFAASLGAQAATGRVIGKVVDATTGMPIPNAQVVVTGTQIGALANLDGRYTLPAVAAGVQSITVTFLGYATKTVQGVQVTAGAAITQDVALSSAALEIEGITVSAARENGSVSVALDRQRTALGITSAITTEQIAKSPDSDAAQAAQRMSGATVQDGKYIVVRGLGERYTTTSLNGQRLPSPEPEKRVVPLDLFPSGILETITTSKTFTPDQSGDFSGAAVNLKTKTFSSGREVQFSLSGGFNRLSTGRNVPTAATVGGEWLGLAASDRRLPESLTSTTSFSALSQAQVNTLIRALPRGWSFADGQGAPNLSSSLTIGGEDPLLFGRPLGYALALSYARTQDLRAEEVHARAVPGDAAGTPTTYNRFVGSTGQTSVLWGGILNLSTYLGSGSKIELNNTYDRTADNEAHVDWGTLDEYQQVDSVRRTLTRYVERTVRSNQIRGDHAFGPSASNRVDWSLTSSAVSRVEPDRADLAYGYEFASNGQRQALSWLGFIPEAAKRTSSELSESALSADLNYALQVGPIERRTTLKAGGSLRHLERDASSAAYNLRALGLSTQQRMGSPDDLFYGDYTSGGTASITLEPNASGGTYDATDDVMAGFAMAEVPFGDRVRLIAGARVEKWELDMNAQPTSRGLIRITRSNTDVLPSLAINTKLTETQSLRLSASQTLARPEYRELAPVSYRDMLGEREVFGDSSLVRTRVQNYDVRWEWYPSPSEALSVAFFVKRFDKPIESIDVATTGASQLSFINAESAENYGAEVEVRKGLDFLSGSLAPYSLFANATFMHSSINTSNSRLSALTNDERPMVGQAPYVVNAGLSYSNGENTRSATLLYNVVGRRIASAAVAPLNTDTYEQPRHLLDFSLRLGLTDAVSAKLDTKNLLDSENREQQGDVIRYGFKTGRSISAGLSWKLF
jgi:outer membrane receptor for ferrienterochelin and colicin